MAVTIADVARRAGVARSTVSYVLSGARSISPETKRRVEQAIEELQFRPHVGARSIRTRRNGVIAMALPMVHGPDAQVQMPYVWAALTAAQDAGLKLLMLTDDDGEAAIRDAVLGSLVDGVMLMEVQRHDPRVGLLGSLKCPAVIVGTPEEKAHLPCVDFDLGLAGRLCAEHLLELGHTRVGYLGGAEETFRRGVAYAIHARDSALYSLRAGRAEASWTPCDGSPADVDVAVDTLLSQTPGLSALIVYNERALPLVIDCLSARGLHAPEDISVMAICPEAQRSQLRFTAVSLPVEELARTAVRLLAGVLNGDPQPPATILAPALKIGDTTAPRR
ncbi:LacI family transcriptional regulator [Actinoallomurus purpureus]|uniref:LacI family DNA-binding transcriptional regulator n=1 Tax=Actinoallomurus purpureus TaxID=478114 RepID=UPI0020938470|nr:LacI family DNA-binding transcriptional regulator [Actinoallomurus purpureus]MCO6003482.1 LacI family transcriptional regulator [Actinoallomurus purpureus]